MKYVGKDAYKKEKALNLREKEKKLAENLRDTRKSRNFASAFRRNRCCLGRSVAKSMLRRNDKQFLILYKKWI